MDEFSVNIPYQNKLTKIASSPFEGGLVSSITLINHCENKAKIGCAFPKLKTSAKSVQTSAEVCADYTCSLYRLQLKFPERYT